MTIINARKLAQLRARTKKHGITRMVADTGLARRTVQYVANGTRLPSADTVARIEAALARGEG